MSAADASTLSLWSALSLLGISLVIVGVLLEGAELFYFITSWLGRKRLNVIWNKLPEPHVPLWAKRLDHIGWFILLVGLLFEFWGHIRVTEITDRENRRLTSQLDSTTQMASAAKERASKFDFAKAELETEKARLEKQAEELRASNLALELKLQPRMITLTQMTNFIFLTRKIPQVPIRIGIGEPREETFNYAWQIRQMLNLAGFVTPIADTNLPEGIQSHPGFLTYVPVLANTNKWADLDFFYNSTNDISSYTFHFEQTNGFTRPVLLPDEIGDTNTIFAALWFCFGQIGITNTFPLYKPDFLSPGQFEVFIRQKPQ